MKEISLVIIFALCSSLIYSQFYSPQLDTSSITADDIPNIVQHLTKAKELLSHSDGPNELYTIPAVSTQVLYYNNVSDTSHLFNEIRTGETLENLITISEDYEFIQDDLLFYEINGRIWYRLDKRKPYAATIPMEESNFNILGNKIVILEQTDSNFDVMADLQECLLKGNRHK